MHLSRFVSALIGIAIAAPAAADVTVRSRMVEQESGGRITDVTEYRKGLKIRTDSSSPGITSASVIMDLGTGRTIMLWHDSKTATEHNLDGNPNAPGASKVSASAPTITPTSQTRTIAGSTCTVMEGSLGLVKDGPGQADFVRIHRAMAKRVRESNPVLTMDVTTAELGVTFASEMTVSVGGNEPNAERRKMASTTTEVTSISTTPIADSVFEIPPGYTVTKR